MKYNVFLMLASAVVFAGIFFVSQIRRDGARDQPQTTEIENSDAFVLHDALPHIEFADTEDARVQGLSGRSNLSEGSGLLFIFDTSDEHGIWMKDMRFAIDIMWFDESGVIVGLKENASPDSYPEVFYPEKRARYVLETPAGFIRTHGLAMGKHVTIPR